MIRVPVMAGIIATGGIIAGQALDSHSTVQLGEALAVGMVIIPGVFWVGGFMRGLRADMAGVAGKLNALEGLKADVGQVKSDVAALKVDVGEVKKDSANLLDDVSTLKTNDVVMLKADVAALKAQVHMIREEFHTLACRGGRGLCPGAEEA